jgi:hypothetical protein
MRVGVLALLAALVLAGCGSTAASRGAATATAAPAAPRSSASARAQRVISTVASIGGGRLVLANGQSYAISGQTRFAKVVTIPAGDLKVGDYVAITGDRQPDNSVLATQINIFPPQLNGVAPGQRPLPGGALMTNATIAAVKGSELDVSWKGGGARIVLAPNAKVTEMQSASVADVQAGAQVAVTFNGSAATSVTIGG